MSTAETADESVGQRVARGRRVYARHLGLDEPGVDVAMGAVAVRRTADHRR